MSNSNNPSQTLAGRTSLPVERLPREVTEGYGRLWTVHLPGWVRIPADSVPVQVRFTPDCSGNDFNRPDQSTVIRSNPEQSRVKPRFPRAGPRLAGQPRLLKTINLANSGLRYAKLHHLDHWLALVGDESANSVDVSVRRRAPQTWREPSTSTRRLAPLQKRAHAE
jgi:hypothetical protein